MKIKLVNFIIYSFLALAIHNPLSAQFTFSGMGNYTDDARWTPSTPGIVYPNMPVIISTGSEVTVTDNIFFNQLFTIEAGASLIQTTGSGQVRGVGSNIIVNGDVIITTPGIVFMTSDGGQFTINGDISGIGTINTGEVVLGAGSFSPGYP